MVIVSGVRLSVLCALLLGHTFAAAAQTEPQAPPAVAPTSSIGFWVSGGLGSGDFHETSGISGRASATLTLNQVAVMLRTTGSFEGIDGHTDHAETSLLFGGRFGGKYLFVIPAVGLGKARWADDHCTAHFQCTPAEAAQYEDEGRVVAFDIGVHAARLVAGVALNITGVAGSTKRNLLAMVVSLELGAFRK